MTYANAEELMNDITKGIDTMVNVAAPTAKPGGASP